MLFYLVAFNILSIVVLIPEIETFSKNGVDCYLVKCDVKITPQHSAQISFIQEMGINENDCLRKLSSSNIPEMSAVYCEELRFCGLDLEPEHTQDLKALSNKSCSLFSKSLNECEKLGAQIAKSGTIWFNFGCSLFSNLDARHLEVCQLVYDDDFARLYNSVKKV